MDKCSLVLFGAGTTGRIIARNNKERVLCFVDSNESKWGEMEGIPVLDAESAKADFPEGTWVASAIIPELHKEITDEIERMGVKTIPVWGFLPQRTTPPSPEVALELIGMVLHDKESYDEVCDQIDFRLDPQTHQQRPPSDIRDIYFPEFITRKADEVYVDVGCADGDTIQQFLERWPTYRWIYGFEPDGSNFNKTFIKYINEPKNITVRLCAIADFTGEANFQQLGDYSSHLDRHGEAGTSVDTLDASFTLSIPTYIKMDIEGSEPAALWGARRILKDHKPVLAICAYHESSHLWEIPLLIHALQPEYELFFRRYAQGSFEIVWYAVPPERVKK